MLGLAVLGHAICTGLLWSSTFNIPVHAKSYNQTLLRAATVVHDSPVNLTTYKYHGPTTSLSKRAASDTMKAALMQSNSQVVIATGVCIATFLTPLGAAICISAGILALVHNFFIFYNPSSVLRRDLETPSGARVNQQNTHAEWLPIGTCSTFCRLKAGVEEGVWTPVGNITVDGIFHDIHFVRSGNVIGLRAWQNGYPGDAILDKRQYEVDSDDAIVEWYSVEYPEPAWDEFDNDDGAVAETDVENWATEVILSFSEANDGVVMCVDMEDDIGPVNSGLWTIWWDTPYPMDVPTAVDYLNNDCIPME